MYNLSLSRDIIYIWPSVCRIYDAVCMLYAAHLFSTHHPNPTLQRLLLYAMTCGEKAKKNRDCIPCCGGFPCTHAQHSASCWKSSDLGTHTEPMCLIYWYTF